MKARRRPNRKWQENRRAARAGCPQVDKDTLRQAPGCAMKRWRSRIIPIVPSVEQQLERLQVNCTKGVIIRPSALKSFILWLYMDAYGIIIILTFIPGINQYDGENTSKRISLYYYVSLVWLHVYRYVARPKAQNNFWVNSNCKSHFPYFHLEVGMLISF